MIAPDASLLHDPALLGDPEVSPDVQAIRDADSTKGFRVRRHSELGLQDGEAAAEMKPAVRLLDVRHNSNRSCDAVQREIPVELILGQAAAAGLLHGLDRFDRKRGRGEPLDVQDIRPQHVGGHLLLGGRVLRALQADVFSSCVRVRNERVHRKHDLAVIPAPGQTDRSLLDLSGDGMLVSQAGLADKDVRAAVVAMNLPDLDHMARSTSRWTAARLSRNGWLLSLAGSD